LAVAAGRGDDPIHSLARLVKALRSASGLSQEELAERAGLSVQAISAIERGTRRHPRPITLRAIASALSLSAEDRSQLWHAAAGQPDLSPDLIAQLPRDVADLTGRESEVATAIAALTSDQPPLGATVLYVWGKPGVGKSALALHVAHRLRSRFPDGQLYMNLQGATVGLPPLRPHDALTRILRSFGLGPASIPDALEEAAARFRSLAADRRLLIVQDNARSV
jgi:transcriptional regulator with XRE-family HTH domain